MVARNNSLYGCSQIVICYKQTQEDGSTVVIPAYKTFLFTPGKRYDQYYGRSIFTALWRNYDKKWKLEYLDSIALQNDAIKPKVLKNTGNTLAKADDKATSKVLNVLSRLGKVNSMATLPPNYELEVLNSEGRDPHQSIERQNSEMARVFLANFMLLGSQGTSSTGSFALSDTQAKMFHMSLESVMNKLAAHINQYLIADLIDINFSEPRYPVFAFEKMDNEVIGAIFNAFTTMIQKDRMSDAMASEIEDATATRLGFDVEKIKQQRTEQAENTESNAGKEKEAGGTLIGQRTMSDRHKHEPSENLKKLDARWQELEKRFLDQIRPVYETVAEEVSQKVAESKLVSDIDAVVFPVEYRRTLVSFFKQGYQIGKISASDEMGKPAAKNGNDLTKAAIEYINWIIEKQQDDLTNYAKSLVMDRVVLDDEQIDYSAEISKLILAWFATKLTDTASYAIAQAVNSGRNSVWDDDDVLEFSAILDARTSPGCSALDGKVMTWKEWQAYPEYIPPRHFNCRSTFVKISDQTPRADMTPPDNDTMTEIKRIQQTPKSELIKDGTLQGKMTKKGLLEMKSSEFELPAKGKISLSKALSGTNPNYIKGVRNEYSTNCQRCVPTYEMRRRGYNVEALPNSGDGLGRLSMIVKMWGLNKNDKYYISPKLLAGGANKKVDYNQEYADWFKFIGDMPNGARAQVGWMWKGSRAGHTIMTEKKAGKLVFIDPQTQSIKNRDEFVADVKARPRYAFWAFRVDNRELDKEMVKLIMKESKR